MRLANSMASVLGIDLGTSNSVVAVCEDGAVTVIADDQGHQIHPSAVAFMPDGSVLVGARASRHDSASTRDRGLPQSD